MLVNSMETNNDVELPAAIPLGANPTQGGHDREAIEAFLSTLYGDAPGLMQTVRAERKELHPRFHTTDEQGIAGAVTRLDNLSRVCGENDHLYVQVSTCVENPNADTDQPEFNVFGRKRGGRANVSHLLCLWTDLDYGTDGHAEAKGDRLPNPPDAETAHKIYERAGLPDASIIVNSGGGLYEIVLLDVPLDVRDPSVRNRVESVSRRWQQLLEKTAREMGYHYGTGVWNLDRLLRVPGTVNTKIWDNKRRATAIYNDIWYTFSDLEARINELHPEPQAPSVPNGPHTSVERWNSPDAEGLPGTDFNNRGDWQRDIFDPAGITYAHASGDVTYWCRPGKTPKDGHGFSLNHKPDLLFAFTDGTPLKQWRYFDKFSALTYLFHGGDFKAAAAELRERGYGNVSVPPAPSREDLWTGQLDEDGQVVESRTPAKQGATEEPAAGEWRDYGSVVLLPSPKDPMAVVRTLESRWQSDEHEHARMLLHWQGVWMCWKGTHWAELTNDGMKALLYPILESASWMKTDSKGNVETVAWAPNRSKVSDLLEAMAAVHHLAPEHGMPCWIGGAASQSEAVLIVCENGLLDVSTRSLTPHTPNYFNRACVPFAYDHDAPRPDRWLTFLNTLWPDDAEAIAALQEWFGYVLSGRTDLQKMLFIVGPPRSGKGTIARILTALVGSIHVAGPTLASLATQFGLASLIKTSLAVIDDARLPRHNTEAVMERLLSIIGGGTLDVDRKNKEAWTGRIPARMMMLSNDLPPFSDASGAISSRMLTLTLKRSFLGEEDTGLADALIEELPGIFTWSLDGLDRLCTTREITEPESSIAARIAMEQAVSPIKAFVDEMCTTDPHDEMCRVPKDALWTAWVGWCTKADRAPSNKINFGRMLFSAVPGITETRPLVNGQKVRMYQGIKINALTV